MFIDRFSDAESLRTHGAFSLLGRRLVRANEPPQPAHCGTHGDRESRGAYAHAVPRACHAIVRRAVCLPRRLEPDPLAHIKRAHRADARLKRCNAQKEIARKERRSGRPSRPFRSGSRGGFRLRTTRFRRSNSPDTRARPGCRIEHEFRDRQTPAAPFGSAPAFDDSAADFWRPGRTRTARSRLLHRRRGPLPFPSTRRPVARCNE